MSESDLHLPFYSVKEDKGVKIAERARFWLVTAE